MQKISIFRHFGTKWPIFGQNGQKGIFSKKALGTFFPPLGYSIWDFHKVPPKNKKSHFNTISTTICSEYFTKISASESIAFSIYHRFCRGGRENLRVAKIYRKFPQNWPVRTKKTFFCSKIGKLTWKFVPDHFWGPETHFWPLKMCILKSYTQKINFKILRKKLKIIFSSFLPPFKNQLHKKAMNEILSFFVDKCLFTMLTPG